MSTWVEGLHDGKYQFEIFVAEVHFKAPNQRKFNVFADGQLMYKDYDIVAEAGTFKEHIITGTFHHKDDNINGPLAIRLESTQDNVNFHAIRIKDKKGNVIACAKTDDFINRDDALFSNIPEVSTPIIYTNSSYSVDEKVTDVISRMSISEKVLRY